METRKHAALLIPHTDRTLETDLQESVPGLILHTQRLRPEDVSGEAERRMVREELPGSLAYLVPAGPFDCAVFGCTSASVSNGRKGMERILAFARTQRHTLSPDAELCFVSCTNLRAAGIRRELSSALGLPVLTANQCIADHLISLS